MAGPDRSVVGFLGMLCHGIHDRDDKTMSASKQLGLFRVRCPSSLCACRPGVGLKLVIDVYSEWYAVTGEQDYLFE